MGLNGKITIASDRFPLFPGDVLDPDPSELKKHWYILSYSLLSLKYSSSADLLKAAVSYYQLLLLFLNAGSYKNAVLVASTLLDIYKELQIRTTSPYQFKVMMSEEEMYSPLPAEILKEHPLDKVDEWKLIVANPKLIAEGKINAETPLEIHEKVEDKMTEEEFVEAIPELEMEIDGIAAKIKNYQTSETPLINKVIYDLKKIKIKSLLENVLAQRRIHKKTDSVFEREAKAMIFNYGEFTLYDMTDIILYHSVYTVMLDKFGTPTNIINGTIVCKTAESPILYPVWEHQLTMKRQLPPPGATFLSLGRYAGWSFKIQDASVKQTLFQMIGGFYFDEYLQTGNYPFQDEIQSWIDFHSSRVVAAVSSDSAFSRKELTFSGFKEMVPDLLEVSLPYVIDEIIKRVKEKRKELAEFVKSVAKEVIIELLRDFIIEKFKWYLIKKIGAKIVPLVNLAVAVVDLFTGEEERRQIRRLVACIRMAAIGGSPDDMTIAGKVMAKVLTDEFESQLIARLTAKAKAGIDNLKSAKGDSSNTSDDSRDTTNTSQPSAKNDTDAAGQNQADTSVIKPSDNATTNNQNNAATSSQKPPAPSPNYEGAIKAFQQTPKPDADPRATMRPIGKNDSTVTVNMSSKNTSDTTSVDPAPWKKGYVTVRKPGEPDHSGNDARAINEKHTDKPAEHKQDDDSDDNDIEASRKQLENRGSSDGVDRRDDKETDDTLPATERISGNQDYTARPKEKKPDDEWDPQATRDKGIHPRPAYPRSPYHHLLPQELIKDPKIRALLEKRGFNIHDHTIQISQGEHSAVHSRGYNEAWKRFFANKPNATRNEILVFMKRMRIKYKITDPPVEPFPKK